MTILPEGIDLNTVVEYGKYSILNGINSPVSHWINVLVLPIANDKKFVHQIVLQLGTTNIYIRYCQGSNFSDWHKINTEVI